MPNSLFLTCRNALLVTVVFGALQVACAGAVPISSVKPSSRSSIGGDPGSCRTPPVPGPVTDGFRPPPQPWAAGNRGLEYASTPGTPVRAAATGTVAFAGPVGGRLVVSIDHPDGRRSTYSPVDALLVAAGQHVRRGQALGRTVGQLHFGVRQAHTYLDPTEWLARPCRAVLVPLTSS